MTEQTHNPANGADKKPLVATLVIAPFAQTYFNELRRQHFPPERNFLEAHLTLFHALPDDPRIFEDLEKLAKEQQPFEVTAQNIVSLGNGTAFKIISAELPKVHKTLQNSWSDVLTNQDRQKRNFHITIQNKVDSAVAKKLQAELTPTFQPFSFAVTGIHLWRYEGGPWTYLATVLFGG
ncbi:2'-5' RNA ligase family protein [Dyadobacter sp. CY343]|uniref:2'-5' RNA ligase family protein n=1 Tax=Dyadobacter sp. CY343 TaxID=2907299 RepID=UPI001F1BA2C4|nr:2'-5' RNA ligase family protein [Dyadobacter sp. CY343]MCE7062193.1 2'-5' RNA ligase family protein [Dyadobacter sp. CY343]